MSILKKDHVLGAGSAAIAGGAAGAAIGAVVGGPIGLAIGAAAVLLGWIAANKLQREPNSRRG